MNAVALAIGQKVTTEDLVLKVIKQNIIFAIASFAIELRLKSIWFLFLQNDPFKIKGGGMVNMKNLKAGKVQQVEDAYDVGIGTQFSAETNKRDEDEEMMK